MKVKRVAQNGFTENILNWDRATNALSCTGKQPDLDQLKLLLNGANPRFQVFCPKFLKKNGKAQQIDTVQLAKTLILVYNRVIMLAILLPFPLVQER